MQHRYGKLLKYSVDQLMALSKSDEKRGKKVTSKSKEQGTIKTTTVTHSQKSSISNYSQRDLDKLLRETP